MANYERHSSGLPMIVKFVEHFHNGVQSHTLSRYAIGYIVRGEKHIYLNSATPFKKNNLKY